MIKPRQFESQMRDASRAVLLCTLMLAATAGCWQEIEYAAPNPTATERAPDMTPADSEELPGVSPVNPPTVVSQPPDEAGETGGFENELVDSLSKGSSRAEEQIATTVHDLEPGFPAEDHSHPEDSEADRVAPSEAALPGTAIDDAASGALSVTETPATPDAIAELDTPPDSTTLAAPETQDAAPSRTRLDTWRLGSKLSLAALANDRGIVPENVDSWLAFCKRLASELEIEFADLPPRGLAGDQAASRQVLDYFRVQGRHIGGELAKQFGPDHAALLEVAMKSNLLRVLYEPESTSTDAISTSIAHASPQAQLPADLWQPLMDVLAAKAEPAEVRKAVQTFHSEVEQLLAEQAEP
jgi:hypothetical protein